MNTTITRPIYGTLLMVSAIAAANPAAAQHYYNQYQSGQFGRMQQTDWNVQRGVQVQDPGAAIVGGLLSGIGQGLHAKNPQKHAVAGHVLNGLGQGFAVASQPTVWEQGSIRHTDQGYYQHQQGANWGRHPRTSPYNGGHMQPRVRHVGYGHRGW